MTQEERLDYLIHYLLNENEQYQGFNILSNETDKKRLLRSLMNVRPPKKIPQNFLNIQDLYLQEELKKQKIISIEELVSVQKGLYLWQGDITKLKADAIVNAGNSALLGCFIPCHGCIDNAIHSYAGVQLRLECQHIMEKQGMPEPTGKAKITKGYNLPAKYVLHTVGPIIRGKLTEKDCELLASCYRSCLELADAYRLKSIAFCCISTGEFHFPNDMAGYIAVNTVKDYLKQTNSKIEVIFNVFKEEDYQIYKRLLG
ncbi:protein-ADP-ribose hydrolase [Thomasclavelia saccharogumia]|uniref:protein-ADP-ribose hydrolase n=1 Tax=Thomasclavelia saccharogumia TaxID=341225 RepID=UPI00047B1274|nr:protein-ADP-ribose hydrolase [Thomasclavelia saccharogumia]